MSHVLRMIAEGEHQQQDFKTRIDNSRKIARTLVAFANADGGRLLVGVKDNGTVCGIRVDEELHMVEAAAEMHCRPAVEYRAQVWKADVRSVLEVVVEPSRQRPHRCEGDGGRWDAYLRLEDENIRVNQVLARARMPNRTSHSNTTVTWAGCSAPGARESCSGSVRFTVWCEGRSGPRRNCSPCWWAGASWKWCWGTATSCMVWRTSRPWKTLKRKGPPCSTCQFCHPLPRSGG